MKIFLSFTAMISFTVIANLLMKSAALMDASRATWWEPFLNWRLLAGFVSFGVAAVIYALLLKVLPLNVAQSFASAQFVAVILASAIVLSEPISPAQWVGIALIACGIAVVGWSRG